MTNHDRYGVELISARRFYYLGAMYARGTQYPVARPLRDHLVGTGYFKDVLMDPVEPQAIRVERKSAPPPSESLSDFSDEPSDPVASDVSPGPVKKKRGRPRKSSPPESE